MGWLLVLLVMVAVFVGVFGRVSVWGGWFELYIWLRFEMVGVLVHCFLGCLSEVGFV